MKADLLEEKELRQHSFIYGRRFELKKESLLKKHRLEMIALESRIENARNEKLKHKERELQR